MSKFTEILVKAVDSIRGNAALSEAAAEALTKIEAVPKAVASAIEATRPGATGVVQAKELATKFDRLPNAFEFKNALADRHVGPLPEDLRTAGTEDGFAKLDGLSSMLRSLDGVRTPGLKSGLAAREIGLPAFTVQVGETPVEVSKANFGHLGHVYKLSTADQEYALKVFNDPARIDTHGAYAESGLLTYLAKKDVGDVMRFHGANPSPDGGWMLSEFLEHPRETRGARVDDVLRKDGFFLGDVGGGFGKNGMLTGNRGPGSIVWDVGGVEPESMARVRPQSLREFNKVFDTADGRMVAGRLVGNIRDDHELKSALLLTLEHPESTGQVPRSARYYMHDKRDVAEVFSKAIETPGGAGRAAAELDGLKGTPFFSKLFYKGLANPESRFETSKLIDHLQPGERAAGFAEAFKYPESRAMAARAIPSIPDAGARAKAIDMAMKDAGSRYVVLMTQPTAVPLEAQERAATIASSFAEHARKYGLDVSR